MTREFAYREITLFAPHRRRNHPHAIIITGNQKQGDGTHQHDSKPGKAALIPLYKKGPSITGAPYAAIADELLDD